MVSRLCISQWQQAWRIYFLLLWFLLSRCYFAVLYNLCCLSALFLTAALWLLPKPAKLCFFNTNELYTQLQNSLAPFNYPFLKKTLCFLLLAVVRKTYFLYFLFYLQFVYGLKEKTEIELLSPLCCLSIWNIYIYNFFLYLVAIKDTLILNRRSVFVLCSRPVGSSAFLPAAFWAVQLGWGWVRSGLSGRGTHWFQLIRFKDLLIRYEVAALSLAICHRVDKPLISCSAWLAFRFW